MPSEFATALGQRLRAVRHERGLSLQAVDERSDGRWKAVVVGSYERGDRAVTVQRLAELAEFYAVPVASLLPDLAVASPQLEHPGVVVDVTALAAVEDPQAAALQRYVDSLLVQRGTPDEPTVALRALDIEALTVVYELPSGSSDLVVAQLRQWRLLFDPAGRVA